MSVGAFLSISCQKDAGRERGSCREANSWKWPFFTFTDSRIGCNGNKGEKKEQAQNVMEQLITGFLSNGLEIEVSKLLIESYMLNVLDQWARIRNLHLGPSLKLTSDLRQVINIPYILISSPYYPSMRECLENTQSSPGKVPCSNNAMLSSFLLVGQLFNYTTKAIQNVSS